MTNLRIEQNNMPEQVNATLIHKLYEVALSISEPNVGEEDVAYLAGNLQTQYAYKTDCDYLEDRFSDLHINCTAGYYITFADPEVERVLKAKNVSSDGVGITFSDASTAVIPNQCFKDNTMITSFNEFKYFTAAGSSSNTNIGERFSGCTNLTQVDLTQATRLSYRDFYNTGITVVNAPNLEGFGKNSGNEAFQNCTQLREIQSLGSITTLPNNMFKGCTLLGGNINLPTLTSCGTYCFRDTAIQTVSSLGSINYMPEGMFMGCNNLTSVTVTEPILEIKHGVFSGCHNLTYFSDDLSNVTNLYNACFSASSSSNNMKFKENELVSFPSVTFIGINMFGQCHFKQLYMPSISTTHAGGNFRDWYTGYCTFGGSANMHFYCDLMYFKDLQKMYSGTFCRISSYALVINNNTPPVWANNQDKSDDVSNNTENDKKRMFCYSDFHTKKTSNKEYWPNKLDINVYVPASAVTAYQADTLWNTYCTIHPISDLNSGVIYANETDWIAAGKPVGLVADKLGLSTADLTTFVNANNLTYYIPSGS